MKKNTQEGGFWMLVETIGGESQEEQRNASEKNELLEDDFFPDTSF